MDPLLEPVKEESFKAGLWMLHEETAKLPPLTDRELPQTLLVDRKAETINSFWPSYAEFTSNRCERHFE
jgi:hypothetical protein